jgi:hypothetical protein
MKQINHFYSINSPIFGSKLLDYNDNIFHSNKNMSNNNSIEISYNDNSMNIEEIFVPRQKLDKNDSSEKKNKEKEKDNSIIDKITKENIQQEIKEKIYLKKPFKEKKKLGRKIKSDGYLGEHNKFPDDNIIRKIKSIILNNVLFFINQKIKINYPN